MGTKNKDNKTKKPEGIGQKTEACTDFGSSDGRGDMVGGLRAGLYLVATPIGNLRDITLRALDTLRSANLVLCEDTRVSGKLLKAYDIKAKMQSYNDHSEGADHSELIERIQAGAVIALISDAGMPMVSDPGYKLVQACYDAGVYVTTVPGANAPLSALQLSGMPSNAFSFIGFLPHKSKARRDVLSGWRDAQGSLIAFEAAPRLLDALRDISDVLPDRDVAVVREITKLYEQTRRGLPSGLIVDYEKDGLPKGEIVLVIAPPAPKTYDDADVDYMIRNALKTMRSKDAAKDVARITGRKSSDIYDRILVLSAEEKQGD